MSIFFFVEIEYLRFGTCGVCLIINMVNERTCHVILFVLRKTLKRAPIALTINRAIELTMFMVFFSYFLAVFDYCNRVRP